MDIALAIAFALAAFILSAINFFLLTTKTDNMPTKEDFQNLKSDINADITSIKSSIGNVAGDVGGLKTKIEDLEKKLQDAIDNGGMTAADEQELLEGLQGVKAELGAAKDSLSALADSTPDTPVDPNEGEGNEG